MILFGESLGHALEDALGVLSVIVEVDATGVLVYLASVKNSSLMQQLIIMGDDCTPGRGIRVMMQPEANRG